MKHRFIIFMFTGICLLAIRPSSFAHATETNRGVTESMVQFQIFLPIIQNGGGTLITPTNVPTLISPVPTTPENTATPIDTPTQVNTITTVATSTPTSTRTPTGTPTQLKTPSPTPTTGPTVTTTPATPIPTSIPFPDITFSCAAVNDNTGNAKLLEITVTPLQPAPAAASFKFVPTQLTGPVNDILRPGPTTFQLVNIFKDDTSATSPGWLSKCDTDGACVATYTLTQTKVTRYLGTTVDCQF